MNKNEKIIKEREEYFLGMYKQRKENNVVSNEESNSKEFKFQFSKVVEFHGKKNTLLNNSTSNFWNLNEEREESKSNALSSSNTAFASSTTSNSVESLIKKGLLDKLFNKKQLLLEGRKEENEYKQREGVIVENEVVESTLNTNITTNNKNDKNNLISSNNNTSNLINTTLISINNENISSNTKIIQNPKKIEEEKANEKEKEESKMIDSFKPLAININNLPQTESVVKSSTILGKKREEEVEDEVEFIMSLEQTFSNLNNKEGILNNIEEKK